MQMKRMDFPFVLCLKMNFIMLFLFCVHDRKRSLSKSEKINVVLIGCFKRKIKTKEGHIGKKPDFVDEQKNNVIENNNFFHLQKLIPKTAK